MKNGKNLNPINVLGHIIHNPYTKNLMNKLNKLIVCNTILPAAKDCLRRPA